jgi:molybdopterin-binding protein
MIDVYLKSGKMNIVSRITRSASEDLGIVIGDYVYAVFKASIPYLIREEYNERIL